MASLGNASALTPGATENRIWEKSSAPLETRLAEPLQTLGGHQENEVAGYDYASASLLAAEETAGVVGEAAQTGGGAPNFIVSEGGTVYPVPEGATGPFPVTSGKGFQYIGGSGGNGLSFFDTGNG